MKPWSSTLDIDHYLNRVIPAPPWQHIPYPVAWFLGHRREEHDPPRQMGTLEPVAWSFVGIFAALILISGVGMHIPSFQEREAPLIVGSFGAMAVLEFHAINSPLAQPRAAFFGHIISAVVGVAVQRLFLLAGATRYDNTRWLAGALACAAATACMALTRTAHPPAGAVALLAVVDENNVRLGWFFIPVVLLGVVLMLTVALIVNNIRRRFPLYWWTQESLARPSSPTGDMDRDHGRKGEGDVESQASARQLSLVAGDEIVVRPGHVSVPAHLVLEERDRQFLEDLRRRLA